MNTKGKKRKRERERKEDQENTEIVSINIERNFNDRNENSTETGTLLVEKRRENTSLFDRDTLAACTTVLFSTRDTRNTGSKAPPRLYSVSCYKG